MFCLHLVFSVILVLNIRAAIRSSISFHFIGILQSRKTVVSRSDWLFSNSALCGWKDQFGNDRPSRTVSRCGEGLAAVQQRAQNILLDH